jgi:hypothetical protein
MNRSAYIELSEEDECVLIKLAKFNVIYFVSAIHCYKEKYILQHKIVSEINMYRYYTQCSEEQVYYPIQNPSPNDILARFVSYSINEWLRRFKSQLLVQVPIALHPIHLVYLSNLLYETTFLFYSVDEQLQERVVTPGFAFHFDDDNNIIISQLQGNPSQWIHAVVELIRIFNTQTCNVNDPKCIAKMQIE